LCCAARAVLAGAIAQEMAGRVVQTEEPLSEIEVEQKGQAE
jgi:hypothetical protein